jgi:hypothetical protein
MKFPTNELIGTHVLNILQMWDRMNSTKDVKAHFIWQTLNNNELNATLGLTQL